MKLFFSPSACSLSPHIVAHEAGLNVAIEKVDLAAKKTASGADYLALAPKGQVPALQLDNGTVLTEGAVIVQYLADQKPESNLAPAAGTLERYKLQEQLNYIATEVHKGYSPLFNPKLTDDQRAATKARLAPHLDRLNTLLGSQEYVAGAAFTVADAYLFTVLRWSAFVNVDLTPYAALGAFLERIGARPAVKAALAAEQA